MPSCQAHRAALYIFSRNLLEQFGYCYFSVPEDDIPEYLLSSVSNFMTDPMFHVDSHLFWMKLNMFCDEINVPEQRRKTVNALLYKCHTSWKNLVVDSIKKRLKNFPESWSDIYDTTVCE